MLRQRSLAAALFLSLTVPAVASADPGELTGIEINTQGNNFGYWEYLPAAYEESSDWPLLVTLTGIGESGDGMFDPTMCAAGGATGGTECSNPPGCLCRTLRHGPNMVIWDQLNDDGSEGVWDDVARPFITIAPQNPAPLFQLTPYDPDEMDAFFDYLIATYAVDERRIYLTGMSIGGYSVGLYALAYPDRLSALSMMPGIGPSLTPAEVCTLTRQNVWAFHGDNDGDPFAPEPMVGFVRIFDECAPPHPDGRITVYEGAGHNVWTRTFNPPVGMGDTTLTTMTAQGIPTALDPHDQDVYSWLLLHDKPDVSAGPDLEVPDAQPTVDVIATTIDDDPITYSWTLTSATGPVTLVGADTQTLTLSEYNAGTFEFEVLAVDIDGQWDRDTVTVNVNEPVFVTSTTGTSTSETTGTSTGDTTGTGSSSDTGTTSIDTTGTGTTASTGSTDTGLPSSGTTGGASSSATRGGTGATSASTGATSDGQATQGTTTSTSPSSSASQSASGSSPSTTSAPGGEDSSGTDTDTDTEEDGTTDGCSCQTSGGPPRPLAPLMAAGMLLGLVRRRR